MYPNDEDFNFVFYNEYMKNKYNENNELNYLNIDYFIYCLETFDFYNDVTNDIHASVRMM